MGTIGVHRFKNGFHSTGPYVASMPNHVSSGFAKVLWFWPGFRVLRSDGFRDLLGEVWAFWASCFNPRKPLNPKPLNPKPWKSSHRKPSDLVGLGGIRVVGLNLGGSGFIGLGQEHKSELFN